MFISEGQIQWSRYSAILTVNTTLVTALGVIYGDKLYPKFLVGEIRFATLIGMFTCVIWLLMTRQGFYWMNYWVDSANSLEKDLEGGSVSPVVTGATRRVGITKIGAYIIIFFFMAAYIYMNSVV